MIFNFTQQQKDVLTGSMLGDGSLDKVSGHVRNSRFTEIHGIAQHDWLLWKREKLRPFPSRFGLGEAPGRKNLGNGVVVNDNSKTYERCVLRTVSCHHLTEMEKVWYKRDSGGQYAYKMASKRRIRIKVLPKNFRLDPLALAVWYMDDGNNGLPNERKQCNLACLSFQEVEVANLLAEIRRLGFADSEMYGNKNGQYCINIKSRSILEFLDFVASTIPDLPNCMRYKVDVSGWKTSWKNSPDYHPQSVLNDGLVALIMSDAAHKVKQREIAKKHGICHKLVNSLIRGRLRYKSEFGKVNYASTTGVEGVTFDKKRDRYVAQMSLRRPDGKTTNVCLGYYQHKDQAASAATEARQMRAVGVTDVASYKEMRKKYQAPVRSTNTSGVSGLCLHNNKWHAAVTVGGKRMGIGSFSQKNDAINVLEVAGKLKAEGVTEVARYLALRPAVVRRHNDLPKGVFRKGNRYVAYYGRNWRKYFRTLEEAVAARKAIEFGTA